MKNMLLVLFVLLLPCMPAGAQDSIRVKRVLEQKEIPLTPAAWYGAQKAGKINYNYYNSLGVACKAELKLEKASHIPFRFRLGSLAQTDYMEQKPYARKPEHP